jgi:hypothetical protein
VKGGISLPLQDTPDKGWLPDGSCASWLNAPSGKKEDRLPVRVTEHSALVAGPDGEQVSETCTLVTTLLDEVKAPADVLRDAYPNRRTASETTFGEDKATSSLAAIAAASDSAARAHLHTLNVPGRDRHSPLKQKHRPKFPHTSATKQTVTRKYQVIVYVPSR